MGDIATQGDQSASTDASQGNQSQQTGTGDGNAIDYGELLEQQRAELGRQGQTVENLRKELESSNTTINRVRKAFSNESEKKPSPSEERRQRFNEMRAYLEEQSLEDQKRGGAGLPVTTKIGKELADFGLAAEERAEKLQERIDQLEEMMKLSRNPAYAGLERAAFAMEGMIDEALAQMYGDEDTSRPIRSSQFNAVTARINDELKSMINSKDPKDKEDLLKIQRNPKVMRQMVNHFLAEMLPPKVRQQMDHERMMNQPQSQRDLMQAFVEAREALAEAHEKGDKRQQDYYSNLMTDIRRDILANQMGARRKSGQNEQESLNGLMRSFGGGFLGGR